MNTRPRWSVVIPYYNERGFLPDTLGSLAAQSHKPFKLILVDNASTDGSVDVCKSALEGVDGVEVMHIHEANPGQCNALETGIAAADTELIAICDADTHYAPTYLARATMQFDKASDDVVAVLATALYDAPDSFDSFKRRLKARIVPHVLRRQCHSGGYGHTFRTEALKRAGGYSRKLWPHLRKDHEMMHRVLKQGRAVHDPHLWCRANDRRDVATQKRWTLGERILYHITPFQLKDWFFYRYLGPRMARRKMDELKLRERPWEHSGEGASSAP